MSRFNTGNPIGSGSPLDLDDNAKNLDVLVNSTANTSPDRFGRSRLSYQGMENSFNALVSDVSAASGVALTSIASNQSAVSSSAATALSNIATNTLSVQTAADEAIAVEIPAQIARLGLEYPPIAYTAGLTLDSHTKTYSEAGALYIWGGALGTVTTGAFDEGDWQPIQGDIQLRDDVTQGTSLIRDVKHVVSVAALTAGKYEGQVARLASYFTGDLKSSGDLIWRAASTETADGKSIFAITGTPVGRWFRLNTSVFNLSGEDIITQQQLNNRLAHRDPLVTNRAPSRNDSVGYPNNRLWQFNKSLFRSSRSTAGARACWELIDDVWPSFGAVNSPSVVCFLKRIVPGYAGPCIRVEKENTGAALDIGFLPDGSLDITALNNHIIGTRGMLATWYDQTGNGHHLTASGAARPIVGTSVDSSGLKSIIFERSTIYNNTFTPEQYMTIPVSYTGMSNNQAAVVFTSTYNSFRDCPMVQTNNSDSTYNSFGVRRQTGVDNYAMYQNSTLRNNTSMTPKLTPQVVCGSIGASGSTMYFDENETKTSTSTRLVGVSFAGGRIGGGFEQFKDASDIFQYGGALMQGLILYDKEINLLNYRNIYRAACRDLDLKPQIRGSLITDGDSITEGAFGEQFKNWTRAMHKLLQYPAEIRCFARGGSTYPQQESIVNTWAPIVFDAAQPYNIVISAAGSNDIAGGSTDIETYNDMISYVDLVKSYGFEVVVTTVLPRQGFENDSKESYRLSYNQMLRDNYKSLGILAIVDYELESTMGNPVNATTGIYYADGTHPTTYGYALLGDYVASIMNPIIAERLLQTGG